VGVYRIGRKACAEFMEVSATVGSSSARHQACAEFMGGKRRMKTMRVQ